MEGTFFFSAIAALSDGNRASIDGIPICQDFQLDKCGYGTRCRYWHINIAIERAIRDSQQNQVHLMLGKHSLQPYGYHGEAPMSFDGPCVKRAAYSGFPATGAVSEEYVKDVEQKNAQLRAEVEGLKSRVKMEKERYEKVIGFLKSIPLYAGAGNWLEEMTSVPPPPPPIDVSIFKMLKSGFKNHYL